MFRFVCLFTIVAVCNAGLANYNGQAIIAPTITSEQQNVLRSHGNLQQISYNSKTIDTPYSSVSKSDVRVSNPGYQVKYEAAPAYQAYHSAPAVAYAAQPAYQAYHAQPAVQAYHAAPAVQTYHSAPAVQAYHAAPAVQTYHAQPTLVKTVQPAIQYSAQPALVKSVQVQPAIQYSAPATKIYSAPAPAVYSAPAAYHSAPASYHSAQPLAYSAPSHSVVAAPAAKLLGVQYSPATAVSHMSYSAPLISYAW